MLGQLDVGQPDRAKLGVQEPRKLELLEGARIGRRRVRRLRVQNDVAEEPRECFGRQLLGQRARKAGVSQARWIGELAEPREGGNYRLDAFDQRRGGEVLVGGVQLRGGAREASDDRRDPFCAERGGNGNRPTAPREHGPHPKHRLEGVLRQSNRRSLGIDPGRFPGRPELELELGARRKGVAKETLDDRPDDCRGLTRSKTHGEVGVGLDGQHRLLEHRRPAGHAVQLDGRLARRPEPEVTRCRGIHGLRAGLRELLLTGP